MSTNMTGLRWFSNYLRSCAFLASASEGLKMFTFPIVRDTNVRVLTGTDMA